MSSDHYSPIARLPNGLDSDGHDLFLSGEARSPWEMKGEMSMQGTSTNHQHRRGERTRETRVARGRGRKGKLALTFLAGRRRDSGRIGFLRRRWCFQPRQRLRSMISCRRRRPQMLILFRNGFTQRLRLTMRLTRGRICQLHLRLSGQTALRRGL